MARARDGAAALEALADLGDNVPTLSARSRATIEGRLTQLGANAEAASLTPDFKLRIAALLDTKARLVWWCFPRLDSEFRVLSASDENAGRCVAAEWLGPLGWTRFGRSSGTFCCCMPGRS